MTPIPLQPNMPMPTDYSGDPVPPKQYYLCPHCKEQSPLTKDWVGLTDEEATKVYAEIQEKVDEHWNKGGTTMMFPPTLYKAIEAKLKELNT